jgi:hypothetical protein
VTIPTNLLLAMGFSVTTALAAKGITVSQLNNSTTAKEHVATEDAEFGDLVKDDGGAIDLTKVQMLGWTLIALGAYFAQVVDKVVGLGFGSAATASVVLPNIDTSLMVLMGLGQAAYLAKKIITTTTPAISGVAGSLPAGARPGSDVTLKGSAFGTARGDSAITFDGVNAGFPVKSWSDTEIAFFLEDPALHLIPAKKPVGVIVSSQKSNSVTLTILRRPSIQDFSCTDGLRTFTLTGSGFGNRLKDDVIKVDDTVADNVSQWMDQSIVFANRAPTTFASGRPVTVSLFLDGDTKATVSSNRKNL